MWLNGVVFLSQDEEEDEEKYLEEISEPQLVQQDNSFLRSEEISLDEFQDAITSCENDLQLVAFLRNKYDLSPMFILQSLRRAVASKSSTS